MRQKVLKHGGFEMYDSRSGDVSHGPSQAKGSQELTLVLISKTNEHHGSVVPPFRVRCDPQVGSTLRSWTGADADIGLLPKGDAPNPSTGAKLQTPLREHMYQLLLLAAMSTVAGSC